MHKHVLIILAALLLTVAGCSNQSSEQPVLVVLETELGNITLALDAQRAPQATNYLLSFIDNGQYDGATLYRSASLDQQQPPQLVQGGVLQGALNSSTVVNPADYGVTHLLPDWESTEQTGLRHSRGTISLARDLLATGQVIPELVFCLRGIPSMDAGGDGRLDNKGFPVFGEVVRGMDIIDRVSQSELNGATTIGFLEGQILTQPITIISAYRQ